MNKSTAVLPTILRTLAVKARGLRLSDTDWAARAGIRKETLSRLRGRESCDFATLQALAQAVGAGLTVSDVPYAGLNQDFRFPDRFDREYEEELLELCASGELDPKRWRRFGQPFFMAGLAVLVANLTPFDRRTYLELAEQLHVGSSQVEAFALWLKHSPVRPSRFLPMLFARAGHAA